MLVYISLVWNAMLASGNPEWLTFTPLSVCLLSCLVGVSLTPPTMDVFLIATAVATTLTLYLFLALWQSYQAMRTIMESTNKVVSGVFFWACFLSLFE